MGTVDDTDICDLPHLGELLLECMDTCDETAILTIESPGDGLLVPYGNNVEMNFAGFEGAATVSVLGVPIDGFTLTGEFNAEVSAI